MYKSLTVILHNYTCKVFSLTDANLHILIGKLFKVSSKPTFRFINFKHTKEHNNYPTAPHLASFKELCTTQVTG